MLYYFALFCDLTVPVYCFISGYGQFRSLQNTDKRGKHIILRLSKFICSYWVIVITFSLLGLVFRSKDIPVNVSTFIGNMLLYKTSYNGAWWFVLTYIFLSIAAPCLINMVKMLKPVVVIALTGMLYISCYFFEFLHPLSFTNSVFGWIFTQFLLFGRTQFPFVLGMLFCSKYFFEILKKQLELFPKYGCLLIIVPALMFLLHCKIESLIVAPITGISTLICFFLWKKPAWLEKILIFFGKNSMDIWLIHMFFYLKLFPGLAFVSKCWLVDYLFLILLSLLASTVIKGIMYCLRQGTAFFTRNILRSQI